MKKQLLFLLTVALGFQGYSQINFEKGYFINNSDEKVDCLIRNMEWSSSPSDFTYKLSENGKTERTTINSVKEFGISNNLKFIRKTVSIDRANEDFNYLTYDKNPTFQEEQLFLKVLIEGKASLYEYVEVGLQRYFYTVDSSNIEQLVFKSYKVDRDLVAKNNMYKQQLYNDLKCSTFTAKKLEDLNYSGSDLSRFFIDYNKCNNEEYIDFRKNNKEFPLKISLRPGFKSSSFAMHNIMLSSREADFGSRVGFTMGLELEYVLPFNKNKWALILEPTYQSFKSETENKAQDQTISIDYKSVELGLGGRHYFFLGQDSKIFINASMILDFTRSFVQFTYTPRDLRIYGATNFAMGLGYKYNDRYSLELRYFTDRDILSNIGNYRTEYKSVSVIVGYKVF